MKLTLAGPGEAAALAAFLGRLLRYDRGAAVRLRSAGAGGSSGSAGGGIAVFGRAPALDAVVVRTLPLGASPVGEVDVTVSAGELLEALDGVEVAVPAAVAGAAWAGMLPPRGGWEPVGGLPDAEALRAAVAAGIAEFRARVAELPEDKRVRAELDRIGGEIWGRGLGGSPLPVRAAHAAYVFGLLWPGAAVELVSVGGWLRLRTPYGSVAVRRGGLPGLGVTPV
ncbi:hypothetical protein ACFQLX_18555 [Streptomyces polyrhachis]|uniref:FAD-binding PCMH-type domain-containing protein n=1 Tax=Streptomyces polyrhachis TaxID=1282885 RepID=A0ABW2GHL3_9ACTN